MASPDIDPSTVDPVIETARTEGIAAALALESTLEFGNTHVMPRSSVSSPAEIHRWTDHEYED